MDQRWRICNQNQTPVEGDRNREGFTGPGRALLWYRLQPNADLSLIGRELFITRGDGARPRINQKGGWNDASVLVGRAKLLVAKLKEAAHATPSDNRCPG